MAEGGTVLTVNPALPNAVTEISIGALIGCVAGVMTKRFNMVSVGVVCGLLFSLYDCHGMQKRQVHVHQRLLQEIERDPPDRWKSFSEYTW